MRKTKKFTVISNPTPMLSAPRRGHLSLVGHMGQTISLAKPQSKDRIYYQDLYSKMDKKSLLEEMVHFQEERSKNGRLTPAMIERGIPLFSELQAVAETPELKVLTRSYMRHLEFEFLSLNAG